MDIHMKELVPHFLLADQTGRALAKAIERAMRMVDEAVGEGLACLQDVSGMPEWRLDEMAWEYNLLYDNSASLDIKREWVRNATLMQQVYGTPEAIVQYLQGLVSAVRVEEWWEYGAEPFHFRVRTRSLDALTVYKEKIAEVVERTKNLRSVYDEVLIDIDVPMIPGYAACFVQTYRTMELQMGVNE